MHTFVHKITQTYNQAVSRESPDEVDQSARKLQATLCMLLKSFSLHCVCVSCAMHELRTAVRDSLE